jgi:predicted phage-related endonuclease
MNIKSLVEFNHETHTYTLNGVELSGVTSILKRYLFADKYANVPEAILNRAAEYGTRVHSDVEMFINGFTPEEISTELQSFIDWSNGKTLQSEVLINNDIVASMIDVVELVEGGANIYDIKTTSVLDMEYLSWQLSIYKYLLTQMGYEGNINLFAIHMRGDKFLVKEVKAIDFIHIEALLDAYRNNAETFTNPLRQVSTQEEELLTQLEQVELAVIEYEEQAKYYKERQKELREGLLNLMLEKGLKNWESDNLKFTVKAASTREGLDSKKIKAELPEVYEKYKTTTQVKESLIIKIK